MTGLVDADEVRRMLADACREFGGQKAWAEAAELSPQYVNDVLRGRKEAGELVASALGLERVVVYLRRKP